MPQPLNPVSIETYFRGGQVGLTASLNMEMKRKIPASAGNQTQVIQPVASNHTM